MIRIVNWNVEWCKPASAKADIILERIFRYDPDIVCITEGCLGFMPEGGHVISAGPDYGYVGTPENRRKVILWSKTLWLNADDYGHDRLPTGRYIAAQTETPIGRLYCRGVCIPWSDAHVRTGRRDRVRWQDHRAYLEGLQALRKTEFECHEVVVGDFNQRSPRKYQPNPVFTMMNRALHGLDIATRGMLDASGKAAIDHVAHSRHLACAHREVIDHFTDDGTRLSDHFGVYVELTQTAA